MIILHVVICISLLISVPVLFWYYILYKNRGFNKIPGPTPVIYLGSLFSKDPYELLKDFSKLHEDYGPIVRIYIGPYINIVLSKPDHIQVILSSSLHLDKTHGYDAIKPWLGEGVALSSTLKWKERRKLLNPTFHFQILEEFMPTFCAAGDVLITRLSKEVVKDSVDMLGIVNSFALDVICETSMGVKIDAQTDAQNDYASTVNKLLEIIVWRVFCPWFNFQFLFWLFANKAYHNHKKYINKLQSFTKSLIQKRRQKYKNIKDQDEIDVSAKPKKALLDFLLTCEDAKTLSNEDIREEIDTFTFAGYDTVTSAMSLLFLELSRNLEIQSKLYEEIKEVTENNDEITGNALNQMKYLDMVVKEGLRKFPSVPTMQRKIGVDFCIDGIKYPKGTAVILNIHGLHNNPEIYPEPEKFDPERFTTENQLKRHNYAYIPFSAGPRNCIGHRFAMLEIKSTVVKVLKNFELLPVPGFKEILGASGILKSKNGVHVRLKKRV